MQVGEEAHDTVMVGHGSAGNSSDGAELCAFTVVRVAGELQAGRGASMVRRRRKAEIFRKLLLKLLYEDRREETEVMEEGGEVTDSLAIEDALVGDICSLPVSEVD